jgi:hypothetical protein
VGAVCCSSTCCAACPTWPCCCWELLCWLWLAVCRLRLALRAVPASSRQGPALLALPLRLGLRLSCSRARQLLQGHDHTVYIYTQQAGSNQGQMSQGCRTQWPCGTVRALEAGRRRSSLTAARRRKPSRPPASRTGSRSARERCRLSCIHRPPASSTTQNESERAASQPASQTGAVLWGQRLAHRTANHIHLHVFAANLLLLAVALL